MVEWKSGDRSSIRGMAFGIFLRTKFAIRRYWITDMPPCVASNRVDAEAAILEFPSSLRVSLMMVVWVAATELPPLYVSWVLGK